MLSVLFVTQTQLLNSFFVVFCNAKIIENESKCQILDSYVDGLLDWEREGLLDLDLDPLPLELREFERERDRDRPV